MPSEIRHVIFSPAEVLEALVALGRQAGRALPSGSVVSAVVVAPTPSAPVRFRVEVAPDATADADGHVVIESGAEELTAALLVYCRARNIPIAMRSEKSLEKFGSRLGLVLTMRASASEREACVTAR